MKSREFLVDITISFPKGDSVEDWSYLGHLFQNVDEDWIQRDTEEIGEEVAKLIETWREKNPDNHDCFDNSEDTDGRFLCSVCASDNTIKRNKVLALSKERGVNPRAQDIVKVTE